MPRLNGFELLDKLDGPRPIVLVTAREYDTEIMEHRYKVTTYIHLTVGEPRDLPVGALPGCQVRRD